MFTEFLLTIMQLIVVNKKEGSKYDAIFFGIILCLQKPMFIALAQLPTMVQLTYLIPDSVEASMSALIFACLNFSYDWGGKMFSAYIISFFEISEENMTNLFKAVEVKLVLVMVYMMFICFLPSHEDLRDMTQQLNSTLILKARGSVKGQRLTILSDLSSRDDDEDPSAFPDSGRKTANARLFSDVENSGAGSDLRTHRSAQGASFMNQTDKFLSDFSNSIPMLYYDSNEIKLHRGKSGYHMNSEYEDYASNDLVRLFMDSLDDADRFVTAERPDDNDGWNLLHSATKKDTYWSWRKQTDNPSVLHSKCIFLFKNVSPTQLFECLLSENRAKWDPQTEFEVLDVQPEYELIYQKQTKIPYSMQRDVLYHNLSRKSFFVCDGKPDVHLIVR